MRTVSFSDARVQKKLNDKFVCCYTNTKGDPSAGASFSHSPDDEPGPCGRGAGRQNVQVICITPEGEIFHVATGFLDPKALLEELEFACQVFDSMQQNPKNCKQIVADAHEKRLRQLGFKRNEIAAADNQMTDLLLSGCNPQDIGINMPKPQDFGMKLQGPGASFFQDVTRQRILKDNKFAMNNPLMHKKEFEKNPQSLVGHHKSFFGSNSAFNGVSEMMNSQMNVSRSTRRR